MRYKFLVIPLIAATMAMAVPAEAGKWYHSPWFWGGTGLVVGGVVGHEIGRHHQRPVYYDHANYHYSPYVARHGGGDVHYRETRVWPFYRRVESYPVASTRSLGRGQGADNSAILYSHYQRAHAETANDQDDRQVNISLGDNNQNVSIVVEGRTREVKEYTRATVPNTGQNTRGRMIDTVQPVNASSAEQSAAKTQSDADTEVVEDGTSEE